MAVIPHVLVQLAATGVHLAFSARTILPDVAKEVIAKAKASGGSVTIRDAGSYMPHTLNELAAIGGASLTLDL